MIKKHNKPIFLNYISPIHLFREFIKIILFPNENSNNE